MAVTIGIEHNVTWGSSEFLVAKIAVNGGTFTQNGDTHDVTARGATATATNILGLRSSTATVTGRFPVAAPKTGYAGNVVTGNTLYGDGSGNVVNLVGWDLDVAWPSVETTSKVGGASVLWRTFKPSVYTATGRIRCLADDTEALVVGQSPDDAAFSLELSMDGTHKFTGSAKLTGAGLNCRVGSANAVEFPFIFTGAVTAVGADNIFAAGALPLVTAQTLAVIAKTGRQYSGSAFPASVNVRVDIGSPIEVTCNAQFTGAVTPA